MIRILTDSASDILPAEAEQLGVTVIPLNVTLEDSTVLRDGVDMTPTEYYGILAGCHKLPTTSQPSPELFENFFTEAAAAGDEVIGIFLSHELSGTYQCAKLAADMVNADNILFVDSENVCLHGITVQNSYSWTIHPIFVKHLDLLNFNINNPYNAPNTDGIDPESCEHTRIIGVNIHVGDDCIAMKASKVFLGMKLKKSCEHTVIRNCLLDKGHGGIVIGSEMSGGVKDMVVTQCLMDHTDRGLRVKTRRGRGNTAVIDGLVFRNVEMRGVKAPFVINMFYFCDPDGHSPYVQCREAMPVDEYTPKLGSLTMEDIVATDAQFAGCYFDGLPEQPIERVSMKNVTITFDPNAKEGQAAMADNRPLVKKLAIYAENVKEIDLHNVKIEGYEGERLHLANVGHFEED